MIARIWRALLKAAGIKTWAIIGGGVPMTLIVEHVLLILADTQLSLSDTRIGAIVSIGHGALLVILVIFASLTGTSIVANIGKGGAGLTVTQDDEDDPQTFAIEGEIKATPEPK